MKFSHLCHHHVTVLQCCEDEARKYWSETMRRGAQAFTQCRWDAARIYLGAAYEIGLIRKAVPHNDFFDDMHIVKPLKFMLTILLADNAWNSALKLIDDTRARLGFMDLTPGSGIFRQLSDCVSQIESARIAGGEPSVEAAGAHAPVEGMAYPSSSNGVGAVVPISAVHQATLLH